MDTQKEASLNLMTVKFEKLKKTIIKCNKCPRLVRFRKKISTEKRKQYMDQTYWGKPVTGFGDINGKIMIVGLKQQTPLTNKNIFTPAFEAS